MAVRRLIRPGEYGAVLHRKVEPAVIERRVIAPPDAVQLKTGEYVSESEFGKLTPAEQAYLKKRGVSAFNIEQQRVGKQLVKAQEEARAYVERETAAQEKWYRENIVEVGPGKEPILRTAFEEMVPETQELLKDVGLTEFNRQVEVAKVEFDRVMAGLTSSQRTEVEATGSYTIVESEADAIRRVKSENPWATDIKFDEATGQITYNLPDPVSHLRDKPGDISGLVEMGHDESTIRSINTTLIETKDFWNEDGSFRGDKYLRLHPDKEDSLYTLGFTPTQIEEIKAYNEQPLSKAAFVQTYFADREWEYTSPIIRAVKEIPMTLLDWEGHQQELDRYNEAALSYIEDYGKEEYYKSAGVELATLPLPALRALYPEVELKDITGVEWAFTALIPITVATAGLAGIAGVGLRGIALRGATTLGGAGITTLMGYETVRNWEKMSVIERAVSVGITTLAALGTAAAGISTVKNIKSYVALRSVIKAADLAGKKNITMVKANKAVKVKMSHKNLVRLQKTTQESIAADLKFLDKFSLLKRIDKKSLTKIEKLTGMKGLRKAVLGLAKQHKAYEVTLKSVGKKPGVGVEAKWKSGRLNPFETNEATISAMERGVKNIGTVEGELSASHLARIKAAGLKVTDDGIIYNPKTVRQLQIDALRRIWRRAPGTPAEMIAQDIELGRILGYTNNDIAAHLRNVIVNWKKLGFTKPPYTLNDIYKYAPEWYKAVGGRAKITLPSAPITSAEAARLLTARNKYFKSLDKFSDIAQPRSLHWRVPSPERTIIETEHVPISIAKKLQAEWDAVAAKLQETKVGSSEYYRLIEKQQYMIRRSYALEATERGVPTDLQKLFDEINRYNREHPRVAPEPPVPAVPEVAKPRVRVAVAEKPVEVVAPKVARPAIVEPKVEVKPEVVEKAVDFRAPSVEVAAARPTPTLAAWAAAAKKAAEEKAAKIAAEPVMPKVKVAKPEVKVKAVPPSAFPGLTSPKIVVRTPTRTETVPAEHIGAMTPEQAQRLYGSEIRVDVIGVPMEAVEVGVKEWMTPADAIKQAQKISANTAAKQMVNMIEQLRNQGATQTQIHSAVQQLIQQATKLTTKQALQTALRTQLKQATQPITRTALRTGIRITITPGLFPFLLWPPLPPEAEAVKKKKKYPAGTIVWRQGAFWKIIPPPYTLRKPISSREAPAGVTVLKGTPQETLTFLEGKIPFNNVAFDLGVTDGFIDVANKRIVFKGYGELTDVGKRIPSPTKGLSIEEAKALGIELPKIRKTKRVTPKVRETPKAGVVRML